ncbi:MAG: AMP-binding protein, partial [Rhodospirillales bacterium]|nr:AMP-binding protein [Rhodospirillales bacterium]
DVVNMYGITETANWIAGATASKFDPEDGLIGTPWGGEIMIRKEDGSMKRQGEGEIVLRSPSIMDGYFERPDETAAALQDGWFRTGDVGRIDARGVVRLTGRIKHEINRAGMKIHPEDIDLLLERHAEVAEACAFGIPDSISGEIVGIAVRTQEGSKVTVDGLRKWCRERLRREAVPERWFLVGEIPKTDRGKINRERVMKSCLNANG